MVEGGSNSGFNDGPNNVPYGFDAFDDIKKASEKIYKERQKAIKAEQELNDSLIVDLRKTSNKALKESAVTSSLFDKEVSDSLKKHAKDTSDNINLMLGLHAKAHKKAKKQLEEHIHETDTLSKQSIAKTGANFTELLAAWGVKALGQEKLLNKLQEKSKAISSALTRDPADDLLSSKMDHPFLKKLDTVQKLSSSFKPYEIAGEVESQVGSKLAASSLESILGLVKGIGPALVEMLPAVAAFGGVAAMINAIVQEMINADGIKTKLRMEVGGDLESIDKYYASMRGVANETGKGKTEILELGEALKQAGVQTIKSGESVHTFMVMAINMNKVLELSSEQWADLAAEQQASGETTQETHDAMDRMYQDMQKFTLTQKDFTAAITEGTEIFKSYGDISGASLSTVQDQVLKTTGLFKSLNIDIKKVAGSLDDFGDPKKARKAAIFTANMLGMNAEQLLNMQMTDPGKAEELRLKGIGEGLMRNKAGRYDLSDTQIGQLGQHEQTNIFAARNFTKRRLTKSSEEDSSVVGAYTKDFENFFKQDSNKGKSLDDFMNSRKHESMSDVKGNADDAQQRYDTSFKGMTEGLGQKLFGIVENIADNLTGIAEKFGVIIPKADPKAEWNEKIKEDPIVPKSTLTESLVNAAPLAVMSPASALSSVAASELTKHLLRGQQEQGNQHDTVSGKVSAGGLAAALAGIKRTPPGHFDATPPAHAGGGMGWLSSMGEGNVGSVAPGLRTSFKAGDTVLRKGLYKRPNTAAYGAFQMDTEFGGPQQFVKYLEKHAPAMYEKLNPLVGDIGNNKGKFAKAWKELASGDTKAAFLKAQKDYNLPKYLNPMIKQFPGLANSDIMKEVAFSTAVQHGTGGAASLFRKSGYGKVSDEKFTHNLYANRGAILTGTGRYKKEEAAVMDALSHQNTQIAAAMTSMAAHLHEIKANTAQANHLKKDAIQKQQRANMMNNPNMIADASILHAGMK